MKKLGSLKENLFSARPLRPSWPIKLLSIVTALDWGVRARGIAGGRFWRCSVLGIRKQ